MRAAAFAIAMAAGLALAEEPTEIKPWVGKETTPELAGVDLDGKPINLKAYAGRVVLLNFWATWCEPCRAEMPSLVKLREKLAGKPFEVLTVNYGEGKAKIENFLRKERISLTVILDTSKETTNRWKVGGFPMTFLVDAKGHIRYSAFGDAEWNKGEPLRIVESLVAEARRAR